MPDEEVDTEEVGEALLLVVTLAEAEADMLAVLELVTQMASVEAPQLAL